MSTPELSDISEDVYNELVKVVFDVLKDGNVTQEKVVSLGQTMMGKVNQFVKISDEKKKNLTLDVFEKAFQKIEEEVASLSDVEKMASSDNLAKVREIVKEFVPPLFVLSSEIAKGKDFLSRVVSMFSKLHLGACCTGRPLPELPSPVKQGFDKFQSSVSVRSLPVLVGKIVPSLPASLELRMTENVSSPVVQDSVPPPPVVEETTVEDVPSSKEVEQNLPEEEKVPQENKLD